MIRCPACGERRGAMAADSDELRHQGAENSPLKNSAPSSLTTLKTSESTSIGTASPNMGVSAKNTGRSIKYSRLCQPHSNGYPGFERSHQSKYKETASMNAIAQEIQTSNEFDQLKTRLKATWMTGDYDLFSRFMEKDAEQFFQRLGHHAGNPAARRRLRRRATRPDCGQGGRTGYWLRHCHQLARESPGPRGRRGT